MRIILIQTFPFGRASEGDYCSLGLKKGRKILSRFYFHFIIYLLPSIIDPFEGVKVCSGAENFGG